MRHISMRHIATILIVAISVLPAAAAAQDPEPFRVVINASNPTPHLTREEVSAFFLGKTTRWELGIKVSPVDQRKSSAVRQSFSESIHGKDVRAIESYWQAELFSGRSRRPPELDSDEEVLSYVRSHAGAVGYVSKRATLGDGVRGITISR